jgi:hypothetical protein
MPDGRLNVDQFAEKVKAKYPEYKDVDNATLTSKIIDKYPEYKDQVNLESKKKEESYGGYQSSFSEPTIEDQRKIVQPDVVPKVKPIAKAPVVKPTPFTSPTPTPILELPKLTLGDNKTPLSIPGASNSFGEAFKTQVNKPLTEQESSDANERHLESQRASGFLENAEGLVTRGVVNIAKAGVDAASGLASAGRSLFMGKDAETPLYNQDGSPLAQDDVAIGIQWLNRKSKDLQEGSDSMRLADNFAGRSLEAISNLAPDVAAAMAMPEIKIGQWGGVAGKYALEALTNSFTRTLALRGGLEATRQADLHGVTGLDKAGEVAKAVGEKTAEGVVMHGLGELSGAFGKKGVEMLAKAGGNPGAITKGAISLAANYAIWGTYGTGSAMLNGSEHPFQEGNDSGIMGVLFELKGLHEKGSENLAVNKDVMRKFVDADSQIKVQTLFNASPESIMEAVKQEGTAEEFHAKGLDYAEQAIKESDPEKKAQLITTSQAYKKVADVKQSVEAISMDKDAWHDQVDNSNLDPVVADAMKAKIDAIHKDYNPDEIKKTEIAKRVSETQEKVTASKENASTDPIQQAKDEVDRESHEEKLKGDKELLKTIVRNENNPVSKVLPGDVFYTMDGTKHTSSGRDIEAGVIYNETGKAIPYDQVNTAKIKEKKAPVEAPKEEITPAPVELAPPPIEVPAVPAEKAPEVKAEPKRRAKKIKTEEPSPVDPIVEPKIEAPVVKVTEPIIEKAKEQELPVKEVKAIEPEVEKPEHRILIHKDIDRITRTGTSPEPDLTTKQSYQSVLKQKWTDLSKSTSENIHENLKKFIETVHDYRNRNRIKSEKSYKEKGAREDFNGLNYWIDSAEEMLSQNAGVTRAEAQREITKIRSDWAKERLPKDDSGKPIMPESTVIKEEAIKPTEEPKPEIEVITPEKVNDAVEEPKQDFDNERIDKTYSENQNLSEIGSKDEYKAYINGLFTETTNRNVLYHNTTNKDVAALGFDSDYTGERHGLSRTTKEKKPIYLTASEDFFSHRGNQISVLVNVKNTAKIGTDIASFDDNKLNSYRDRGFDSASARGTRSQLSSGPVTEMVFGPDALDIYYPKGNSDREHYDRVYKNEKVLQEDLEFVVFDSEQIHVLGSTKDIDGFKDFIDSKPKTSLEEEVVKKEKKPRAKKEKPVFEQAIEDLVPDTTPIKPVDAEEPKVGDFKEEVLEGDEITDTKNPLSQVGFDASDKPVFVLTENRERYDKMLEGINKKLARIENDEIPEGSTAQKEEAIIRALKEKLKSLEVKPTSFKTQKSESAKQASALDKAETKMNKMYEDGKKQARAGQASMGSFANPDFWVGNTKVIVGAAGSKVISTVKDLKKVYNELYRKQQVTEEFDLLSNEQRKNLLKLVKAEQARLISTKSSGQFMDEAHDRTKKAAVAIKKENSMFSKKGIAELRYKIWDHQGNLVNSLHADGKFTPIGGNSISETYGAKAERLLKTLPAAYSRAQATYLDAMNRVYGGGILSGAEAKGLSGGEQKLLSDIALYKRIIELDTKRIANGEELMDHPGGLDIVQAKQKLAELEAHDQSIIGRFGKYDYKDLSNRADEYYKVLQDLIDYRYANGLITKGAYDVLKDVKYYSPRVFLKHLVDEDGFYSNKNVIDKSIQRIKDGSEGDVVTNLAKLMADAINVVYETSARNVSNKAIGDLIENGTDIEWGKTAAYTPEFIKRVKEIQDHNAQMNIGIGTSSVVRDDATSKYKYIEPNFKPAPTGFKLVTYRDGGIKRAFYLKEELAMELDGLKLDGTKWLRTLSLASTVTKLATGTNWYFAFTNPFRDAGFALFTTSHYNKHFPIGASQYTSDFITSLKDSFLHTGEYNKYIEQGGGNDYLHSGSELYSGEEKSWKRDWDKAVDLIGHRLPSTFESAGRLAIRKRVIKNLEAEAKKNGSIITPEVRKNMEEQASYEALKVLNFSEGGSWTKKYNVVAPFTNVGVIASRNLVRHARSNPKEFYYKVAQLTAFSVALASWNNGLIGDDKDKADYYTHNIPEREKASNFIVMTPIRHEDAEGNLRYAYIKIPKSQDQMLITGLAEYGSMRMAGIESYTAEKYRKHRAFKDVQGLISYLPDGGNLLPPVIKGGIGYVADYDFFKGENFTKNDEMKSRKDEDEYDINTPERWKTFGKITGASPIRSQGAFKSTIPTNNQWFDIADEIYTKVHGEDTKATLIKNQTEGTMFDQIEKRLDKVGMTETEKREAYKQLTTEVLTKIPGLKRLIKFTAPTVIDEDRDDTIEEEASRSFHEIEPMKDAAYEFKHGLINKDELFDRAKQMDRENPFLVVKAFSVAKTALKMKRGTPEAFDIVMSGIQSPGGQARLLTDKMKDMSPEKANKLVTEIRRTGLFNGQFWYEFKKLTSNK